MRKRNSKKTSRSSLNGWREKTGATYKRPPTPAELGLGHTRASISKLLDAARRDQSWALVNLGGLYQDGIVDPRGRTILRRNDREAARCLERAAELGDMDGIVGLADLLSADRNGRGLARAVSLYRRAYGRGDHTAAFNLACTYQNLGRFRDAVTWFRRALEAGDPDASMELARAELNGLGTRRNVRSAFARLRAIANGPTNRWPPNGDRIEAILVMADALVTGWPVRRNYNEGLRWLRRARSLGSKVAAAMLEDRGET
jgi:TPR repeat protein